MLLLQLACRLRMLRTFCAQIGTRRALMEGKERALSLERIGITKFLGQQRTGGSSKLLSSPQALTLEQRAERVHKAATDAARCRQPLVHRALN